MDATPTSDVLAPLSALTRLPLGLPAYYEALIESPDLVVKVGAYGALLDLGHAPRSLWDNVLELARYGAVQMRAYHFFQSIFAHDMAEKVLANEPVEASGLVRRGMLAEFHNDEKAMVEVERLTFLADGNITRLHAAATHAEAAGGWRAAAEWIVRATILHPIEATAPTRLGQILINANQFEALTSFVELLENSHAYPTVRQIYGAALALERDDPKECIKLLRSLPKSRPERVEPYLVGLRARAAEALGEYRDAYTWHQRRNKLTQDTSIDAGNFARAILRHAEVPIPESARRSARQLPHDGRVSAIGHDSSGERARRSSADRDV